MIYLAQPYSHPDPLVMDYRARVGAAAAYILAQEGKQVFSPIAHGHLIDTNFSGIAYDYWLQHGFAMLDRCQKMIVLALDGWEASRGVKAEIHRAASAGIPIEFRKDLVHTAITMAGALPTHSEIMSDAQ